MSLEEKAVELLQKYTLCDYCLGRQFSNISTGTTNRRRGLVIKEFLTLNSSSKLQEGDVIFLQKLSESGTQLAKKTLQKKQITQNATDVCYICRDKLQITDELVDIIIPEIEKYNVQTLLIGTVLPKEFYEREKELKSLIDVPETEYLKQEFNRLIGKKLADKLPVETDFNSPEIIVEVEPLSLSLTTRVKSLYIYGRYNKYLRTLPQTRWPCNNCKGKGCSECNNTGKKYLESVEELAEHEAVKVSQGEKGVLHGAGREDIDALMLGTGRPFVLEIIAPRNRLINLSELQQKTNKYAEGKIEVHEYRWSSKDELRDLKGNAAKTSKKYRAKIQFDSNISKEQITKVEEFFNNRPIDQRTPQRVSHRRADLIRKKTVFNIKCTQLNDKELEASITCDGGCYVKELISGDNGRTTPSLTEIVGIQGICKELDVLEVSKYTSED